jgi:cyclase
MAPFDWAKKAQELGAGEIFLTSIDQDGSLKGYDLNLIKKVSDSVDIPVIASGGVGNWQHLVEGIQKGGADAVSVANLFHFTEHSTKKAKEYMLAAGLDVRDPLFYKVKAPRRPIYEV